MSTTAYNDVIDEIVSSTHEVFTSMIPMEISYDGSFYQKEEMISTDVMSFVSFRGEHSGIFAVFCSKDVALKITSNMLGIEATELDQEAKDAIGEVTNMIAGTVKNKIYEKFGAMHLSVPIVIAGGDLTISSSGGEKQDVEYSSNVTCNSQNPWLMTPFSSNGSTFNVGFVVKKND